MTLTPAEARDLHLIAHHGKAERDTSKLFYVWRIGGEPKSRTVDSLIRKQALNLSADKSTATLSQKGKAIMRNAA